MFCSRCGTENPDKVHYCKNCGSALLQKQIDKFSAEHQINVCISIIAGICTGAITGIFSAAIVSTAIFPVWGWALVFVVTLSAILIILWNSFSSLKRALDDRVKRE